MPPLSWKCIGYALWRKIIQPLARYLRYHFSAIDARKRKGFRACGRDQRAFRSPFGNLRPPSLPVCLQAEKPILFSSVFRVKNMLFQQPERRALFLRELHVIRAQQLPQAVQAGGGAVAPGGAGRKQGELFRGDVQVYGHRAGSLYNTIIFYKKKNVSFLFYLIILVY